MISKLPYKDFLKSFEFTPRVAIELLIENEKGELLLTKRENEPFTGFWHVPGGFILKGEAVNDCIKRLAKEELNLDVDPELAERFGLYETLKGDHRGHVLHHPIRIKLPYSLKRDYFKNLPKDTIPFHINFLEKVGYKVEA